MCPPMGVTWSTSGPVGDCMKITIEKKSPDAQGRQALMLTRNFGSVIDESGKRKKKRRRQSLDLFVYQNPKDKNQREHNKSVNSLAENIRAKALVDYANNKHCFEDLERQKSSFFDFMEDLITEKQKTDSASNYSIWVSTLKHLRRFHGLPELSFEDIDAELLNDFKQYLQTSAKTKSDTLLSTNTASSYFNKVRAALNLAFQHGIIRRNPVQEVKSIKIIQNKRNYLTDEELRKLASAECRYDVLRRAFLFSCLTGIRWSDIQKFTWCDLSELDDGHRIVFNHKKTKHLQYLDLPEEAVALLGSKKEAKERIFKGLKYSSYVNVALSQWMIRAGITKHITFHCARHTFAVRMLTHGIDIYTVSKLLGHSELKTTQVYADIIEHKRKEAMNSLPSIN